MKTELLKEAYEAPEARVYFIEVTTPIMQSGENGDTDPFTYDPEEAF